MIFDQLVLNKVKEIETNNIGELSSVSAIYVEAGFSMKDSGGIDLFSLREELRQKSIGIFSDYYSNLNKSKAFFEDQITPGVELLPNGTTIDLERVEFTNTGEEECERVDFKKVFFIPSALLTPPTEEPNEVVSPSGGFVEICNVPDFRSKVKFIQTFMKINFLALQRPKNNEFVKGINFRKFSTNKKKLTKFISLFNSVLENNKFKINKLKNESVVIYFSKNLQTVSKITFKNPDTGQELTVFSQTEGQFNARAFEPFSDARANFYVKNFDSIYPDLAAASFKRKNINFRTLVARNFLAPGVSLEDNDCMSQSFGTSDASAAALSGRLREVLRDQATRGARSLLQQNPFKTVEELAKESSLLDSPDIKRAMKKKLKQELVAEGRSIVKEGKEFFAQLQGPPKEQVDKLGRFVNSIEWEEIIAMAAVSIAARYGAGEILDEDFIKKQLAERISKHFTGERALRDLMGKLGTAELQAFAVFFSIALLEQEGKTPESEEAKLNLIQLKHDELNAEIPDEVLENPEMSENPATVLQYEFNTHELASKTTKPTELDFLASPQTTETNQEKKQLFSFALNSADFTLAKEQFIDIVVNLSNCDRQNNADLYTKMIMFLIEEFGGPMLDYFDEWSEFINAWDVNNLDFCNLPDLNIPKFKLFPINITIPDISFLDIFKFIFNIILAALFALLLKLIQAIIEFVLSLIPDFIFDFEPCEFANALKDFSQVLRGVVCQAMNGEGPLENRLADIGCKILDAQTSNEINNRDLVNFFKDSCRQGLLPGASLVELLGGDASEETKARAAEYFRTVGNEALAVEITNNPEILSQAGGAIGSVVGITDLVAALDNFEPTFPGLNSNGFVSNLDLCSDPEASDILDELCTEPNPELRQQLLRILEQQRESDREDSAKLFGYLANPQSLTREIEDQIPNLIHPSLVIPGLVRDGQLDQIPLVKNSPSFALNRDEQTLLEVNTQSIKSNLESLDSSVASYGSSLIRKSNKYKNKIEALRAVAPDPFSTEVAVSFDFDESKEQIISGSFSNDLFIADLMPAEAKEKVEELTSELSPETQNSKKLSFDLGVEYYKQEVFTPLQQEFSKEDTSPEKVLTSDIFSSEDLSLFSAIAIENGHLVKEVIDPVISINNSSLDLDALSVKMKITGEAIIKESLQKRIKNTGLDLGDILGEIIETEEDEDFTFEGAANLLPTTQQESVINNYLTGDFEQTKTYKRFIKSLPEYSELLLAKTDSELAVIKETIKTIINSIVLEEVHARSALLLGDWNEPYAINDTETAVYNLSTLNYNVEDKINLKYSDFAVKFFEITISGYNAISYYLYEIEKTTGNLAAVSNSLGRTATPKDLMNIEISKAIKAINSSFEPGASRLLASEIEGKSKRFSVIYNFETPSFFSSVLSDGDFEAFLSKSAKNNQKNMFLSSNLSFEVVLKPGSEHYDAIQSLDLEQINLKATNENVNNLFITRKSYLKRETFDSLKNGEAVLLDYDDVFSVDFNPSEDKRPLMASIFNFAIPGDDFESFIFESFTVKPVYRVFTTCLTKEDAEAARITVGDGSLSRSENRSLGIFKKQKVNSIYSATNNRIFNSSIIDGEQIEGAGFALVELASYQGPLLNAQTYTEFENPNLIRRFMKSEENSTSAQDFKKNASINILLSCLVPYSNIINEATSYVLEGIINKTDEGDGPGRKLLSPIEEQIEITHLVSKRILSNVK